MWTMASSLSPMSSTVQPAGMALHFMPHYNTILAIISPNPPFFAVFWAVIKIDTYSTLMCSMQRGVPRWRWIDRSIDTSRKGTNGAEQRENETISSATEKDEMNINSMHILRLCISLFIWSHAFSSVLLFTFMCAILTPNMSNKILFYEGRTTFRIT